MIKRLVKYGNSQAIVLDKALLEILNISDTTQLKLSTDGTSLTITPIAEDNINKPTKPQVSIAENEAEMHYATLNAALQRDALKMSLEKPELLRPLQQEFKTLMDKFNTQYNYSTRMMEVTNNPLFKEATKKLAQQAYVENWSQAKHMQKSSELMQEFMPDVPLKEFQQACQALEKKHENTLHNEQPATVTPSSSQLEQYGMEQGKKALDLMLDQPELWQQIQHEYQQVMDAFDKKYNYNQRLAEIMQTPLYKDKLEQLNQQAITEQWNPTEHGKKIGDLMQSCMPEIPLHELAEMFSAYEKKYEHLFDQKTHA